jgi:hypothetical protein
MNAFAQLLSRHFMNFCNYVSHWMGTLECHLNLRNLRYLQLQIRQWFRVISSSMGFATKVTDAHFCTGLILACSL